MRGILSFLLPIYVYCISCISDTGKDIDTWFLIKRPGGTTYMYSDPDVILGLSTHDLNSTREGALGLTLNQLWVNGVNYILFNDEPLGMNATTTYGHTKGIWAWSGNDALILTHSVPLFPAGPALVRSYHGLGANAYTYAQHMACFSTTTDQLNLLASIATLTAPAIYDTHIDADTPSGLRNMSTGVRNKKPFCNHTWFQTVDGINVTYVAKSSQWNNELYAACVAPLLTSSLIVESWVRGSVEGPSCGIYAVLDAKLLNFSTGGWKESQDHSKWAIGLGSAWICAGDINRMFSQYGRGGSAFCYEDGALATVLNDAVVSTDSCSIDYSAVHHN